MSKHGNERQRIAQDQRNRTEVERRFEAARSLRGTIEKASKPRAPVVPVEVRAQRAAAELSAAYRRISPADRAAIDRVYHARGWPAVRQALLAAKVVSAETLSMADGIVERSGLEGLGAAVAERVQAEEIAAVQATAEREAAGALAGLTDAQWMEAERIAATGGPQAVFAAAQSIGLSPQAAMVAARTVQSHGVAGLRQGAAEIAQREGQQAEARESAERTAELWTPKDGDSRQARAVKEASPIAALMRDPAFHARAEAMAARLEAVGVKREPGSSAAEFVLGSLDRLDGGRFANAVRKPFDPEWSEAKQLEAMSAILGAAPESVRKELDTFETARTGHHLVHRMSARDANRPDAPARGTNPLRDTIATATARRGASDKPVGVGSALGATIGLAAGHRVELSTSHAERDAQRMADGINNPAPDTSLRGAIEAAMEAEDDETTRKGAESDE
jgi:hypothetical protein